MVGAFNKYSPVSTSLDGVFHGSFHLFTEFDQEQPWYDLSTGSQASDDDVATIQLPPDLRPEFRPVSFVFFARKHRLFFPSNELGVSSAQRLVQRVLRASDVSGNDIVDVTIEQDRAQLELLLSLEGIKNISVTILRPNPDSLGDVEDRLQKRLRSLKSSEMRQEFDAEPGEGIEPDTELRQEAEVALSNGQVDVKFRNEQGIIQRESTADHPAELIKRYDPKTTDAVDEIYSSGVDFLGGLSHDE
jgi:hypothetical protein